MRFRHVVTSVALGVCVLIAGPARGIERHWNANFGSPNYNGAWDTLSPNWNTQTNASGTQTHWVDGADAVFDVDATYTVSVAGMIDASAVSVRDGRVTLSGAGSVAAANVEVGPDATLLAAGDRFLRAGTTMLQLDGTLQLNQTPGIQRLVELRGGGLLRPGGTGSASIRVSGGGVYSGRLSDFGSSRLGLLWSAGQPGVLTLSGDNDAMTGSVLLSVHDSVLRLAGPHALGTQSYLRFEGSSGTRTFVELAVANLARALWTNSNSEGGGGLNCVAPAGFYATGADRNLELLTAPGSTVPGLVDWGIHGFTHSTLALGHENATHTLRWVNPVNLNGAARTIEVRDGAAAVEAEIAGDLAGDASSSLVKTGEGTLRLSGGNSYRGATTVAAGTLVMSGTHIDAGDWSVQPGARLCGPGVVALAPGRTLTVHPGGRLAPGTRVGTLTVAGSVELLPGAALEIELSGPSVGDRLENPTGPIVLGGDLLVSLLDGFVPAASDRFEILDAPSIVATLGNLNPFGVVEVVGGIGGFEIEEALPTRRVLTGFTRVGDVSRDGVINNQDIAPFVSVLTGSVPAEGMVGYACDANRDGVVNNQDISPFVALLTAAPAPLSESPSPLPEPSVLAAIGWAALAASRRARRSRRTRA